MEYKSLYEGTLIIEKENINLAILDNKQYIISTDSVKSVLQNHKNALGGTYVEIPFEAKNGKENSGYGLDTFVAMCEEYMIADKGTFQKSIDLAIKILKAFTIIDPDIIIEEVTGYNMSVRIAQELEKDRNEDVPADFGKAISHALKFDPKK